MLYLWRRYQGSYGGIAFTPPDTSNETYLTTSVKDSCTRSVSSPVGTGIQTINAEPTGEPFLSLHQNHYHTPVGTSLGALKFSSQDSIGGEIRCKMDGVWTSVSKPTLMAFYLTQENFATPRYQALGINSTGSVAIGGLEHIPSSLVSFGVYRKGVMQLPKIDSMEDLKKYPQSDGMITFLSNCKRFVVSENGKWKYLITTEA